MLKLSLKISTAVLLVFNVLFLYVVLQVILRKSKHIISFTETKKNQKKNRNTRDHNVTNSLTEHSNAY